MKTTPGPWEISGSWGISKIISSKTSQVAMVDGRSPEETEANAHLLASAPELLEACKIILPTLLDSSNQTSPGIDKRIALLQKAIIKAEGRGKP
jgi:hypothetical protein